jgi:hypothetical protein
MKNFLLTIAALIALLAPAKAADVTPTFPTKAPASGFFSTSYPYQTSGIFFGAYASVGAGSVNANVPGINGASLTTTTGDLGVTAGYAWGQKNSSIAYTVEGDFGFTNFNGANVGLSLNGPLEFEQRATVWMPYTNLAAYLPNFPNIFGTVPPFQTLPPNVTASNLQMGLSGGIKEKDISLAFAGLSAGKVWRVEPVIRANLMEQLSNGFALYAYAEVAFPTQGKVFGPVPGVTATLGNEYTTGLGVRW